MLGMAGCVISGVDGSEVLLSVCWLGAGGCGDRARGQTREDIRGCVYVAVLL